MAILVAIVLGSSLITHDIAEKQGRSYLEQAGARNAEELEKAFLRETKNMETVAHMTAHIMEYEYIDTQRLIHLTETTSLDGIEYIHVSGACFGMDETSWDVREKDYFQDALKGNSGYAFDDAPERGVGNVLVFYAPIKSDDGKFDGILCGYRKADSIASMLDNSFWGQQARAYLCTGDGTIIAGNGQDAEAGNIRMEFEQPGVLNAQQTKIFEHVLQEKEGSFTYGKGESEALGDICSFKNGEFLLLETFPSEVLSSLYAPAHTNIQHAILTVCFALLLYVVTLVLQNMKNRKRLEEENEKINALLQDSEDVAEHDALTGLLNRRGMSSAVRTCIHEGMSVALIILDIDHFKEVNDTYGHIKGDETLMRCADVLKKHFDSGDLICRMGGDEFVLVLRNRTIRDVEVIKSMLLKVNEELKNEIDGLPGVSVSCGVAFTIPGEKDKIFNRCDEALYEAKRSGRSCICVFEEWMHD